MQMCEMFKTFLALFVLVATVASVPIAPPSISPTISPTIWLTDCVESCEILDDVDSAISAGNIVGRVTMSKYFTISFEFKISALPSGSEVRNIMDIRDTITDDSLVRIGVTRSGNLQSAYNNTVYNAFGPKVLPNIPGPFTECELSFDGTNFMTWTDEDDSWYDRYHINTTEVATAGKEYFIFASNIDPFNPTAGGVIKEIEIESTTAAPSRNPTRAPTAPTRTPTAVPTTVAPSANPSAVPSPTPSASPSASLTVSPSIDPTAEPTLVPSATPSAVPSAAPTASPSIDPTAEPTLVPSTTPSAVPSAAPTASPSIDPTAEPTLVPSATPSAVPSAAPTASPSIDPTAEPTLVPSATPSAVPSAAPTASPSIDPTAEPTLVPSAMPSANPSGPPSADPSLPPSSPLTVLPSADPTAVPSPAPSTGPSVTPTETPSAAPSTTPSKLPSVTPTASPTVMPSNLPTADPSTVPTAAPSSTPTVEPTMPPTALPSDIPTADPTCAPSLVPSTTPTTSPSSAPSADPSQTPTELPSVVPSELPSQDSSQLPSQDPSAVPSQAPSELPSQAPSQPPSQDPSAVPSQAPSELPSQAPSAVPCQDPSQLPSQDPSAVPSQAPSELPTASPSLAPSASPTQEPSRTPTVAPNTPPSVDPSRSPSVSPTAALSAVPTMKPTSLPSMTSEKPNARPTASPSTRPTVTPSAAPTAAPTVSPAPGITSISVAVISASPKTKVQAEVTIAGGNDAIVHCGVFAPGSPPHSVNEVRSQRFSATSSSSVAAVSISGLLPAATYSVYCATQSFEGVLLTLDKVLAQSAEVTTGCCKEVSVALGVTSLAYQSAAVDSIAISVDALPASPLTLTLTATPITGTATGATAPVFYPSSVEFSASSLSKTAKVTVVAGTSGAFTVGVQISGTQHASYGAVFSSRGSTITVLGGQEIPATPQLQSATFSGDGSSVEVVFDSATNKGGFANNFLCSSLLNFQGSNAATCQWKDSSTIAIYPSNAVPDAQKLVLDSPITLIADKVKAACTQTVSECAQWLAAGEDFKPISAPAVLALPKVGMSLPSTAGGCQPVNIDLSASQGSGGRIWEKPTFSAMGSAGQEVVITTFLNRNFTFGPPVAIPSDLFGSSGVYTISVSLCNFLGACGQVSRSVNVNKAADSVLTVTIPGQPLRTMTTDSALWLSSLAFVTSCKGERSSANLQYSWSVYDSGMLQSNLTSSSLDRTTFRLAKYKLTPKRFYEIRLHVRNSATGVAASTSVTVEVVQSEVVVRVPGGTAQSIAIGGSLTLDASSSVDGDVPLLTGSAAGLSFTWRCVQTTPTFSTVCPMDFSSDGTVLTAPSSQKLQLFARTRAINATARVTVTANDASRTRSSTLSVSVRAQDSSAPVVAITSTAQAVTFVNTRNTLLLSGSVAVQTSCAARWSVDGGSVDLASSALTPPSLTVPSGTTRTVNLLLAPSVLPVRSALVFTLSCGPSSAKIEVTTNGPSLPGRFLVTPSIGSELSTPFQFSASEWSDPNLPLTYQFGFTSATTGTNMVVQSRSESAFRSTTLPAGLSTAANVLECTVLVFDVLNAAARSSQTVTVNAQTDTTLLQSSLRSQLSASTGSNDATKSVISISSAVLNVVSCAGAPVCANLNRGACAKVENTCGECLAGFVGELGNKNSPCANATTLHQQTSTSAGAVGSSCSESAPCSGWAQCDTTLASPVCVLPSKQCANKCSGQGKCVYHLVNNPLSPLSDCKVGDPSCTARCSCNATFTGPDCSVSQAYMEERQALRSTFLQSLLDVSKSDDVSADSVEEMSNSLAALTQNSYELSESSMSVVSDVANTILTNAADLGTVSYDAASSVLAALDASVAAAGRAGTVSEAVGGQLVSSVSLFVNLISSQLVAGQGSAEFVQDSFRISSLRQLKDAASSLLLSAPLTSLESASGTVASSVTIDDSGEGEEFSVDVVSTSASAYGELGLTFNTNPLRLTVSRTYSVDTVVKFTLVHNAATEFTNSSYAATLSFNSTCTGKFDRSVFHHTCPMSGEVLTHNCTGLAGTMTSYCPVLAPSCGVLDSSGNSLDTNSSLCQVTGYDAYTTNCTCTLRAGSAGSRRRRLSLADSGVLNVVSSSVYLANEFTSTFNSADDFDSLEDLRRVLIVIVMFSALWAGGLTIIFGCAWRRRLMMKVNEESDAKLQSTVQKAEGNRSPAEVRRYLTDYVVETFPAVFSNKPFFSRLYGEIMRHHKYLNLFTAPAGEAGDKQRIITGAHLLSVQTMLLFSLALLYNVQGPVDDGTCVTHTDQASCLARKSPFDASISYCVWNQQPQDPGNFACEYQEPHFTIQAVIFITVIIALLVGLLNYPIDAIFELLSAPVADDIKLSKQEEVIARDGGRIARMARRASNAAAGAVDAVRKKLGRTRRSIVGTVALKIPPTTEAAHSLATASVSGVADTFRRTLHQRQMSQLRSAHSSTVYSQHQYDHSSSDDSSGDSDSDSEAEDESEDERVRKASDVESGPVFAGPPRHPSIQSDVDPLFSKLIDEVCRQRRLLKPCEMEEFDAQWGLDPTGEFTHAERSTIPCLKGKLGSRELILKELEYVKSETAKRVEKLNIATDTHSGLEILHLFIQDLLGRNTPAAIIFSTKASEDFSHTTVVSKTSKRLAVVALVAINCFFVYYALLTGFRRGLSWQRMYLFAYIMQFVVEILLFETMECVWINCCIPALVSNEVRTVGDHLIDVVQQLCAGTIADSSKFLNAPDYLFVSTNVAKKFPHLMESILVQAYSNHTPGELAKIWQVGAVARIRRHQNLHNITLMATVLATLQFIGTAPFIFHRMFIRFLQPFVFASLVLLWELIISDPIYIAVASVLISLVLAYTVYKYYRQRMEAKMRVHDVAIVRAEYESHTGTVNTDLDVIDDIDHIPLHVSSPEISAKSSSAGSRSTGGSGSTGSRRSSARIPGSSSFSASGRSQEARAATGSQAHEPSRKSVRSKYTSSSSEEGEKAGNERESRSESTFSALSELRMAPARYVTRNSVSSAESHSVSSACASSPRGTRQIAYHTSLDSQSAADVAFSSDSAATSDSDV